MTEDSDRETPTDPAPAPEPTLSDVMDLCARNAAEIRAARDESRESLQSIYSMLLQMDAKIDRALAPLGPLRHDVRHMMQRLDALEAEAKDAASNGAGE